MFEGLVPALHVHGDRLHDAFERTIDYLSRIAENTSAEYNRNTWIRLSVPIKKEEVSEVRNTSGYGWNVKYISAKASKTLWYADGTVDSGFLEELGKGEGEKVDWYVPPGSVLLIESPEAASTANLQVEQFATEPKRVAHTGKSDEAVDMPNRVIPIPSGHPLDYVESGNGAVQ